MMLNDGLILALSADLVPVRRRRVRREAALLLALGAAELALLLGLGLMRPDMGRMIASPYMLWKLGSLAMLAGVGCTVAIRSFSPIAWPRRGLTVAFALAIAAMIGGMLVAPSSESGHTLLDRLAPVHGVLCAVSIVVLSMPMMALLAVLMRGAAPTHPESSALAAGFAAGASGAFVFAFCCPINDPLYIVVWYSAGCAAVAATARWLLPRRFRL
ncbi:NrsF family protein [Sphingomonas sp. ERG5]|uniref:NrsF family protein n=1 Tax=Sphingomonas sp. ERG5 TaxID=1381597 RepID=UPI001F3FD730|nr:NrsF family protein [Sphingomonas sp. ERG5]